MKRYQENFEKLYQRYNRRQYVHPDPLSIVYRFEEPGDREVAALIASSLAFGNVSQILRSLEQVFSVMHSPCDFIGNVDSKEMSDRFSGFRHRWVSGENLVSLLRGIRDVQARFGSLERAFTDGIPRGEGGQVEALARFSRHLASDPHGDCGALLPDPRKGSACKRLNLFLRWMVRSDEVDPGGWKTVSPANLIVPLDTHMHSFALGFELTKRKQADMKTALEVTGFFREMAPEDPVKYDFVLTRFGIRPDLDMSELLGTGKLLH